ncbi:MAG: right-handed parallel beta-helix repeat-containing protein [Planctomycetota bacterium]
MRIIICMARLAVTIVLTAGCMEFYVATNGNDTWSGRMAEPNAEKTDGPFATLERARDEIQKQKPNGATVFVRGGTYFVSTCLEFGPEDSGAAEAPIVYRAYESEKPILVGGKPIIHFVPHKNGILKADLAAQGLKGVCFKQIFFDGKRMHLARYPNFDPDHPQTGGWAYVDGKLVGMYQDLPTDDKRLIRCKPADAREWANPAEGMVLIFPRHNWWNNLVPIASVDRANCTITLARDCSYGIRPDDRYFVMGLFEELDAPGEWYLDVRTDTLYFRPPGPVEGKPVYAPTTRTILDLKPGARHIILQGLALECSEGTAVAMKDTEHCLVKECAIRNVGDYNGCGVSIGGGKDNGVVGCDISDTGSHGISLSGGDTKTLTPAGNYAEGNHITRTGVFYRQGSGVAVSGVGNRVAQNHIHHVPRFGVLFSGNNHIIELNHIHHVSLETEDTGAIYGGSWSWLSAHGVVIRHNLIHDVIGCGRKGGEWKSPYFAWGIYLDWTAMSVHVHGNIVARAPLACIHLHDGRDNVVENNIFVEGGEAQVQYNGWTTTTRYWPQRIESWIKEFESVADQPVWHREGSTLRDPRTVALPDGRTMHHNVLRRNILCYRNPDAMAFRFRNVSFEDNPSDYNLVWNFGQPIKTGALTIKRTIGPNLAPNPGFEEGNLGGMPSGWTWQVRPTPEAEAITTDEEAHTGKRSLRIRSATTPDLKGKEEWRRHTMVKSGDIAAKPGQVYRLSAWLKADRKGVPAELVVQSYKANTYHLHLQKAITVDTEWCEYEHIFKFPAEGDRQYHPEMKTFYIRPALRQDEGVLWVDNVCLQEAEALDEWESWQALGMDRHSLIADPMFVAPEKDDYRLKPDSPAFKLGFEAIPVEKIGGTE